MLSINIKTQRFLYSCKSGMFDITEDLSQLKFKNKKKSITHLT